MRQGLLVLALVAGHARTVAQCANDNVLTGAAVTIPCPGTVTVPCVQGGQYALVNVTNGNIYTFSTCTSTAFDTQITLYDNAGGAALGYNDDLCGTLGLQSSVQWTATFSGQMRVLVDEYNCISNGTCIPLTVNCAAPPPPVTNNNPCQAIALTVNNACVNGTYSNVGANLTTSPAVPAPGCGNLVAGSADVWFTFVAPPTGIAIIETGAGTLTDGVMALYTATACSGTYNLVECSDDVLGAMPYLAFDNLTPGQTYYLRVWGYGTATGSFTLCVHGPTSMPSGNCVYMLELYDGFGDGWGGSTVTVSLNGVPVGTYTCNTVYDAFLIGVNIGQVLVVSYAVNGGPFQGENLYTLSFQSTGQVVFNSGSPPAAGANVYSTTITCNPPPAAPEDCVGGITLCNGQGINNNTNSTGSVEDLDPSNYGCLLAAEQQGTWYNFSVVSGGTLGMTIDPSGPDDYDWAIWGPFPTGSTTAGICPPLGTPIRCSFASGLESLLATGDYNTGMGVNNLAWANPQYAPVLPIWSDPAGGGDGWTPGINVAAGQVYLLYISNFSLSGQAFNLSWQLGSGASLDCTVLPVELLSFGAENAGGSVLVHWKTAAEQDASHFAVLRSLDGQEFDRIGRVEAVGNAGAGTDYAFLDGSPFPGLSYYRLAQVDLNGQETVTEAVVVERDATADESPFPNPTSDVAWWQMGGKWGATEVLVVDALGHRVSRLSLAGTADRLVAIPIQALPRGAYTLIARDPEGNVLARTTLVKY